MSLNEKKILIIDDEPRMANSLRDLLLAGGYQAEVAYGGSEGLELLSKNAYHVVVTDLRMPDTDGIDVMSFIANRHPNTLIIVITGHATTESAIEAVHYHVFDYLKKPFDFDLFRMAIEKAFQKLETDQLREDTAAMITHDIKIPLTSIIGFADMLYDREKGTFHPQADEFVETIQANGQKILMLIENYLTTCKIEAGSLNLNLEPTSPGMLIDDVINTASSEAIRNGHSITTHVVDAVDEAMIDSVLIERALGNLLQNAIKYGTTTTPIEVQLDQIDAIDSPLKVDTLLLAVVNEAVPPLPADFCELFQRFERSGARPEVGGSGLGLYVVDAVAKAHHGAAAADILNDGRVCFKLLLPLEPVVS